MDQYLNSEKFLEFGNVHDGTCSKQYIDVYKKLVGGKIFNYIHDLCHCVAYNASELLVSKFVPCTLLSCLFVAFTSGQEPGSVG